LDLLSEVFKEFTFGQLNLVQIYAHVHGLSLILLVGILATLSVVAFKAFSFVLGLVLLARVGWRFVKVALVLSSLVGVLIHFVELGLIVTIGHTHWHEGRLAIHLWHVRRHPILPSRLGLSIRHLVRLGWEPTLISLVRHAHIGILSLSISIRGLGVHLRFIIAPLLLSGPLSYWIRWLVWVALNVRELRLSILGLPVHHLLRLRSWHFRWNSRLWRLVIEVLRLLK
jgi:hypothetical protein